MSIYQAICFDFDFTLGNSTLAMVAGFAYAFPKMGHPVPPRSWMRGPVGGRLEELYVQWTGDKEVAHQALFRRYFMEVARVNQLETTTLFPHAEALLRRERERGTQIGVITSKTRQVVSKIFHRLGQEDLFDLIIGSEDVGQLKPSPQGIQMALERMQVPPSRFLFCGDTVVDGEAALQAGVDFAAVLNGRTPAEDFADWPHVYIAEDLQDLDFFLQGRFSEFPSSHSPAAFGD